MGDTWEWDTDWACLDEIPGAAEAWAHHGLAITSDDEVVGFHARRIVIFGRDGHVARMSTPGLFEGHQITLVRDGNEDRLWIADPGMCLHTKADGNLGHGLEIEAGTGRAVLVTLDGAIVDEIPRPPLPDGAAYLPTCVAVDERAAGGSGDVWVADGYGSSLVHRYDEHGRLLTELDGEQGAGRFDCPHAVFIDRRHDVPELYVADRGNARIQVFTLDGTFVRSFGEGVLTSPSSFAVWGDSLVVAELNARLAVFDAADELVEYVGDNGAGGRAARLAELARCRRQRHPQHRARGRTLQQPTRRRRRPRWSLVRCGMARRRSLLEAHTEDQGLMTGARDIEALVARLTLDEKASLTAGADLWSTVAIERADIPSVRVTDGPNGARGASVPGSAGATAACVPCGAALGATWDVELIERIGGMLGEEARSKACRVLLAPTVNIHRSPLAGRNFECYSEDPLLTGRIAAAFIRGVQAKDVATTVKHFAGNEAEFERMTISSVIDERTLREIYLLPFELAVREGGTLGVMTSYNRLNGSYCTDRVDLLADILRGEWGFEGFVITDWFAATSTVGSATAGTDLEMPGPARAFGSHVADAVRSGDLDESLLDAQARRLLSVFDRVGALDDPADATERSDDRPEHRALAREAAAASVVLLRNEGVLPLDLAGVRSVAVVGPNADRAQIMGGGSASLSVHYRTTPLDALRARLGDDVAVAFERGCDTDRTVQPLAGNTIVGADGSPGLDVEFFGDPELGGDVLHRGRIAESRVLLLGQAHADVPAENFSLRATGRFTPAETGTHTFTLIQAGRARLLVDDVAVLDGMAEPPGRGTDFFGLGSEEVAADVELTAGRPVDITIEYSSAHSAVVHGVKIGCRVPSPPDLLERAVRAATDADLAIVVIGTNDDWESEGHDRTSLELPGEQDELVRRVLAANANTVVVLNTGAPVTLDWADDAPALLQMWFGGQEMANALVDVLTGEAEPGGRLPTTFPKRLEDNPSFGNFPGEYGEVRYGEGLLVGYRWYDSRQMAPRFAFGHGLSYTTIAIDDITTDSGVFERGGSVRVSATLTNTGSRAGSEVLQCYVAPLAARVTRPHMELKAFRKVALEPGATTQVQFDLDDRAFAYWDPTSATWRVDSGQYEIHVGRSSTDIVGVAEISVD